jgi:hypothetical protein
MHYARTPPFLWPAPQVHATLETSTGSMRSIRQQTPLNAARYYQGTTAVSGSWHRLHPLRLQVRRSHGPEEVISSSGLLVGLLATYSSWRSRSPTSWLSSDQLSQKMAA